jgi:hypothetical protein
MPIAAELIGRIEEINCPAGLSAEIRSSWMTVAASLQAHASN